MQNPKFDDKKEPALIERENTVQGQICTKPILMTKNFQTDSCPAQELAGTENVHQSNFDDKISQSAPLPPENAAPGEICINQNLMTKKSQPDSNFAQVVAETENVHQSNFDDKKSPSAPLPPKSAASGRICKNQDLMTKKSQADSRPAPEVAGAGNVHQAKSDDKKSSDRFERLRSQILERKNLIAIDGTVAASWVNYRGKRLGPYYRVAFRENRTLRAIYIGRDEQLAKIAKDLLDELKRSRREGRWLRRMRAAARDALLRSLAEAETFVAPLGYHRRGFGFHKSRKDNMHANTNNPP
jgi:hypothetical protein